MNFDTDVHFLEEFIQSLGDPTVVDTSHELRQVRIQKQQKIQMTPNEPHAYLLIVDPIGYQWQPGRILDPSSTEQTL